MLNKKNEKNIWKWKTIQIILLFIQKKKIENYLFYSGNNWVILTMYKKRNNNSNDSYVENKSLYENLSSILIYLEIEKQHISY